MATQASRLFEVHPWGVGDTAAAPRRHEGSVRGPAGGIVREAAGGLFVVATCFALWAWFLAATW